MKLLGLVSVLAVAALTGATPFSCDNTVAGGVDSLTRREFLARSSNPSDWSCEKPEHNCDTQEQCVSTNCPENPIYCSYWCSEICASIGHHCADILTVTIAPQPTYRAISTSTDLETGGKESRELSQSQSCKTCKEWMKKCKRTQCARPWAPECQWGCQNKMWKEGPAECRKGAACSRSLSDSSSEVPDKVARDLSQPQSCETCKEWMKKCKRTQCARPWAPECQWDCQNKMWKEGPAECRKGAACGRSLSDSASEQVARELSPAPKMDCEPCRKAMDICKKTQCTKPGCEEFCRNKIWREGPAECRKGSPCGLSFSGSSSEQVARELSPASKADCGPCKKAMSDCTDRCAAPFEPSCINKCRVQILDHGPPQCSRGSACEHGSWKVRLVRDLELTPKAGCAPCVKWMGECRRKCDRPVSVECTKNCQAQIQHHGPPECQHGGTCQHPVACHQGQNCALRTDDPTCGEWYNGCLDACKGNNENDPACAMSCHTGLCEDEVYDCINSTTCMARSSFAGSSSTTLIPQVSPSS